MDQTNTQTPETPTNTHAHQPTNHLKLILLLILVAVLSSLGTYYVLQSKSQPQISTVPTLVPTQTLPSPIATADETANWKVFNDDKYQFSFKYPSEAVIIGNFDNYSNNKLIGKVVSMKGANLDLTMSLDLNFTDESILKTNEKVALGNSLWYIFFDDPKGNCPPGLGPCVRILQYQTKKNNKLVTFTFREVTKDDKIAQNIISSFKFSDQTGETANWKVFNHNDYSFKYPVDWIVNKLDYLNSTRLTNSNKTLTITVSEGQYPYGFSSSSTNLKIQYITVKVGGKSYQVKEITDDTGAFVDFKIDTVKKHHILYGTGYPASEKSSLSDYNNTKEIIFKILSTFKFLQ
ncbi:hypothetical protein HYW87_00950 [Candidatus Roizmanbacteria bacterium]|nr:hypothetical protein [Candidatus Roizmanbacteria bacterium]